MKRMKKNYLVFVCAVMCVQGAWGAAGRQIPQRPASRPGNSSLATIAYNKDLADNIISGPLKDIFAERARCTSAARSWRFGSIGLGIIGSGCLIGAATMAIFKKSYTGYSFWAPVASTFVCFLTSLLCRRKQKIADAVVKERSAKWEETILSSLRILKVCDVNKLIQGMRLANEKDIELIQRVRGMWENHDSDEIKNRVPCLHVLAQEIKNDDHKEELAKKLSLIKVDPTIRALPQPGA